MVRTFVHGEAFEIGTMIDARYLVDYASDAAFAIDDDLTIVAWNYGARRLLGYIRREVLGRHCSEVLQVVSHNGEPLCVPDCEGARCFRHFRAFSASSCRVRHKDGGWVPVNISSVVMPKKARPSQTRSAVAAVILRGEEEEDYPSLPGQKLQIFTLGRFGLAAGGRSLAVKSWERKQAVTLLKYLVANLGRPVHRETLVELLWPEIDEDRGWKRLKVTIHSLRHQLRSAGIVEEIVETVGKNYALRREAVWVDSEAFEKCIGEGAILQHQQQWDKALHHFDEARRLYRGDYMEEDVYADWCTAERERLFEIYLELLTRMAECHARVGHFAEAVRVCRDALIRDPVRESFHRTLMEYLVRLGNAEQAMAQYHDCRRLLARELDVEPMPETQRLYQNIHEEFRGVAAEKLDRLPAR
jgi:PAS domain S-box-containing protein